MLQERARGNVPLAPTGPDPVLSHYLTEPATTVSLIGIQACSLLPNRPAIWLVKRKKTALSPLGATVLVKKGLMCAKDLKLYVLPSFALASNPRDQHIPTPRRPPRPHGPHIPHPAGRLRCRRRNLARPRRGPCRAWETGHARAAPL